MLWAAGGVGRGVVTVAWDPRSATDFGAEIAVPYAAPGLALTGVLPPQVSIPAGEAASAATAEVPAPPLPRAGSSAHSAADAGVLSPAIVPSGGGPPGCSCASRFASEAASPAGPCCVFGSGAWPALAPRRPPLRPRGGRPGS